MLVFGKYEIHTSALLCLTIVWFSSPQRFLFSQLTFPSSYFLLSFSAISCIVSVSIFKPLSQFSHIFHGCFFVWHFPTRFSLQFWGRSVNKQLLPSFILRHFFWWIVLSLFTFHIQQESANRKRSCGESTSFSREGDLIALGRGALPAGRGKWSCPSAHDFWGAWIWRAFSTRQLHWDKTWILQTFINNERWELPGKVPMLSVGSWWRKGNLAKGAS